MRNPSITLIVLAAAIAAGCTPFSRRSSVLGKAQAIGKAAIDRDRATEPDGPESIASPLSGPTPQVTEKEAMAQIAVGLGRLAEGDPALHAEVLQRLAVAPPSLWSLTVDQAISTMRYRHQMAPSSTLVAESTPIRFPPTTPEAGSVVQASALSDSPAHDASLPQVLPPPTQPLAPPTAYGRTELAPTTTTHATRLPSIQGWPLSPDTQPVVVGGAGQPAPAVINNHHAVAGSTMRLTSSPIESAYSAAGPTQEAATPDTLGLDWRAHAENAIESLRSATPERPRNSTEARELVRLRLLQLAVGESEQAIEPTAGLSGVEQQYWSNQLWALATLLDDTHGADTIARADAAARHQDEASAQLHGMGSLQIRNLLTVERVDGYGAYQTAEKTSYRPGDRVMLYAEIDNYSSRAAPDGYRTSLSSRYRLISSDGAEAASGEFPVDIDDLCLARRRDFYIQYAVSLPTGLKSGDYRLELTVTDQLGEKFGADEVAITVVGR